MTVARPDKHVSIDIIPRDTDEDIYDTDDIDEGTTSLMGCQY